jgi:hypothetical protein
MTECECCVRGGLKYREIGEQMGVLLPGVHLTKAGIKPLTPIGPKGFVMGSNELLRVQINSIC